MYDTEQEQEYRAGKTAEAPAGVIALFATERDAQQYELASGAIVLALIGAYLAAALHVIPVWAMVLVVVSILPRWMIYFHELFHVRKADQVTILNRLMLLPFTPLSLGYREFREIHWGHHKAPASDKDPDAFHILGGPLRALLGALTLSEQALVRWLSTHKMDRQLAVDMTVRLIFFVSLVAVSPEVFFVFWLSLRITYAFGDFVFFHYLHVRDGLTGTFPLVLPEPVRKAFTLISGKTLVSATIYHDRHHAYPRVAAHHLSKITLP